MKYCTVFDTRVRDVSFCSIQIYLKGFRNRINCTFKLQQNYTLTSRRPTVWMFDKMNRIFISKFMLNFTLLLQLQYVLKSTSQGPGVTCTILQAYSVHYLFNMHTTI